MENFGYPKTEKLKQKKYITLLFEKGKWKTCGKIRMIMYRFPESQNSENSIEEQDFSGVKVGVSVSKRYFKKATDRNRIKRLLREAYRLNNANFKENFGDQILVMLFWNSPEKPQKFSEVEEAFLSLCLSKK